MNIPKAPGWEVVFAFGAVANLIQNEWIIAIGCFSVAALFLLGKHWPQIKVGE